MKPQEDDVKLQKNGVKPRKVKNILIYGGTFDPIHQGHINTMLNIQQHLHFKTILFLPCKTPVLKKQSQATAEQRLNMLHLALDPLMESYPICIDTSELNRDSPSYMVTTLNQLRIRYGHNTSLSLLMGMDVFFDLPRWHNWSEIINLTNLLLIDRPGFSLNQAPEILISLLKKHEVFEQNDFQSKPFGKIYHFDAGHFNIASSEIRQLISKGEDVIGFLPEKVNQYIKNEKLYL
jgi:nicotinate-nucleotide adenylyltransferase